VAKVAMRRVWHRHTHHTLNALTATPTRTAITARRTAIAALALTALAIAANAALTHTIDRLATDLLAQPYEETTR